MAGIDNIRSGQTLTTSSRGSIRADSKTTPTQTETASSRPGVQSDSVSLSSEGKAIGEMHDQMMSKASFNRAKVDAIKDAIANGSYRVDAEKLADNMIKFEKELGTLK